MISLAKHIELLLLDHDCVIVPELGTFIANHASACYNEDDDSLFLPPYRNICFNQNIVSNVLNGNYSTTASNNPYGNYGQNLQSKDDYIANILNQSIDIPAMLLTIASNAVVISLGVYTLKKMFDSESIMFNK